MVRQVRQTEVGIAGKGAVHEAVEISLVIRIKNAAAAINKSSVFSYHPTAAVHFERVCCKLDDCIVPKAYDALVG